MNTTCSSRSVSIVSFFERNPALANFAKLSNHFRQNSSPVLWTLSAAMLCSPSISRACSSDRASRVAVVYSAFSTWVTHFVARALMPLHFRKQRAEAEFRFMMVGVREHAEQIALYRGATTEVRRMRMGFEAIRVNFWQLLRVNLRFTAIRTLWGLLSTVIPIICSAPRYFAHAITLGDVTQIARAFEMVGAALFWLVDNYETVQIFRVVVRRLHGLELASERSELTTEGVDYAAVPQEGLTATELVLRTPQGDLLNQKLALAVRPGERWLITGESGVGKSSLIRAVAGIWPYGSGVIRMPSGANTLFLSQKNYVPSGTFKAALCYPAEESDFSDEACRQTLRDARLPGYAERLHEVDRWAQRMSPGEQQRLAFGRALLLRPDFLFLDESTSALDPATERAVYSMLVRQLPHAAIVHISHRASLDDFHTNVLHVTPAATTASVAA